MTDHKPTISLHTISNDINVDVAKSTDKPIDSQDLSSSSSHSSFVPIDRVVVDAVQVIDESKAFNDNIMEYIESTTSVSIDNNYHIVSVFGSQLTGKSTLLNHLFNTNFDVMDESQRQQTTKGIWLAHSPNVSCTNPRGSHKLSNIFVMDVEGTDGRERGEDQDFERKSALFALSTSEVLIINIWEHQIGLYQGANLGLLKTVFEVNLSLFGKSKLNADEHRVLLLFVIRDYVGVTPIENLANTITSDLIKMWDDLNKPTELNHLKFEDFFDIKFHTLSHKILQNDKFIHDIKLLGDKFNDKHEYWKPAYHHNIPIDAWTLYASNCWQQIDSNQDLDLPTQQILVAKFKCDEILNSLYDEFVLKYNEQLLTPANDDIDYKQVGLLMQDLKSDFLLQFEMLASKYNPSVYSTKYELLNNRILTKYTEIFNLYGKKLCTTILKTFKTDLGISNDEKFIDKVNRLKNASVNELTSTLSLISLGELVGTFEADLIVDIDEIVSKQKVVEMNNIINKLIKKLATQLNKLIAFEVNDIKPDSWDTIEVGFQNLRETLLKPYCSQDSYDFGLGIDEPTTKGVISTFHFKSWVKFHRLVKKNLNPVSILNILRERFENKFRYDENGVPKLFTNEFELDKYFNDAKSLALQVLPQLTIITLSNSTEIVPEYNIFDKSLLVKYDENLPLDDDEDNEDDYNSNKFSHIITETEKNKVLQKFKREIDARYIETKRSLIQNVTSIPYYIYIIIVVLGWNEFLAIIRSPVFFMFTLLLGGGVYVMYQLNLIKPAMIVGQRMANEAIDMGKQKLKEFLIDDNEIHARNLNKISGRQQQQRQEIKLNDLSEGPKKEVS